VGIGGRPVGAGPEGVGKLVEAEAEGVEPLEEPEDSRNWRLGRPVGIPVGIWKMDSMPERMLEGLGSWRFAKLALSLGAGPDGVGLTVGVRPEEAELLGKPEGTKIWRFSKGRLVGKPDGKPEGIPVGVGAPEEKELQEETELPEGEL
jgi:hypothetical protein